MYSSCTLSYFCILKVRYMHLTNAPVQYVNLSLLTFCSRKYWKLRKIHCVPLCKQQLPCVIIVHLAENCIMTRMQLRGQTFNHYSQFGTKFFPRYINTYTPAYGQHHQSPHCFYFRKGTVIFHFNSFIFASALKQVVTFLISFLHDYSSLVFTTIVLTFQKVRL